jgi:molybdopterin molybdotransferase
MISFDEAIKHIFDNTEILGKSLQQLENAAGYVLHDDIISSIDVVSFRNSAMDGFAIKKEWLKNCSGTNKITLSYSNTIFAGDQPGDTGSKNKAVKIMTGAPVPEPYDTVVIFEDTVYDDKKVTFNKPVDEDRNNIREPGEDIRTGQKLFGAEYKLRPLDIGIIAGIGMEKISVYRKPDVLIVSTGSELVNPGEPLKSGQIYNSNMYTVGSIVGKHCNSIETKAAVADDLNLLTRIFESKHDVIITTGGVSAGEKDYIKEAAESAGWKTIFHKIRIKPGKPVYFARKGKQLLFGLPGNPLSTAVTCSIFAVPALKKMSGYKNYQLNLKPARLGKSSPRKSGRMVIWPGMFSKDENGIIAEISYKKSSAALSALLGSDGLIFQSIVDNNENSTPTYKIITWHDLLN